MKFEKRVNSDGSHYYRFVHYNPKTQKTESFTREEIRKRFGKDIVTLEEAKECLKLFEAKFESEKIRIQRRITWQEEFYSFSGLLEQYKEKQKKRAPNSWKNNVFYLKHYVLYFFLQEKRLNLIDLWPDHFEAFKVWLETAKKVRGKGVIAFSSKNHAIKALNTFLDHLDRERTITFAQRCEAFGEYLLNSRDIDDVVHPHEMEIVYKDMIENGHKQDALLYRFLYFSGMRYNEALAISVGDLFQGEIGSEFLRKKVAAYDIKYFGYVVSEGQFKGMETSGHVLREPFKGRKVIAEKFNRIFPVIDKVLWNAMVDLAEKLHEKKAKHLGAKDLLLFPKTSHTTSTVHLKDSYDRKKLKWRSWHCLRHSRATYLIGETSDAMLARVWLGHSSPKTLEKYNHMYQAIVRAAKGKELTGKAFGLKRAK
jgi:integrase